MRDYQVELTQRVAFIQGVLAQSGATGIVYGNSGGKDSALVGILCKKACNQVLGVMMPCQSVQNFKEDIIDGQGVAEQFAIENLTIDLTQVKVVLTEAIESILPLGSAAKTNINPRLRMITLYALAQSRGALVAGTGNRSERHMGYFTKWGDGACDFNPIADLTVAEIYEFLRFLDAPASIITKAPSAGLFEGQTDEGEMGLTYQALDHYLMTAQGEPEVVRKIETAHHRSHHKRQLPLVYQSLE